MKPSINLHIEVLVLDDFDPADRHRIGDAVERELARLLADQGAPPSLSRNHSVARLHGGTFEATPASKPEAAGGQIAQAIHGGLGR